MQLNYSGESISIILLLLLVGVVCFAYNKSIARELARIYLAPIKWMFKEKPWMQKVYSKFALWMRITLYGASLICLLIIISELGAMFNLF